MRTGMKAFFSFLSIAAVFRVQAFVAHTGEYSSRCTQLSAGRGMGMATGSKKKSKGKKINNGMGKASDSSKSTTSAFDVNASMLRLEKKYDDLLLASAKQLAKGNTKEDEDPRWSSESNADDDDDDDDDRITTEYVVAVRAPTKAGVMDWVPVAQICLVRPESEYENSEEVGQAAVSSYCRELSQIAAFGAPVFSTVARNHYQYSIESIDSFQKHVYERVIDGSSDKEMTKTTARETLGLESNESEKSSVKQAYRKLSFELHPDRFDGSPEECEAAAERFGRVKLAYETMSSGVRVDGGSWYESLGGRARTGFFGPINLLPLVAAQEQMDRRKVQGALIGLDRDLIQTFVARNLRSE